MKTKIGKGGIFAALAATLLITTALIMSCSGPSGGGRDEYEAGKGKVKLTIDGIGVQPPVNSRSILPGGTFTFTSYDLAFQRYTNDGYGTTAGTKIEYTGIPAGTLPGQASADIALEPGYWEVEVVAYTSGTPVVEAAGTERFIINAGMRTNVVVGVGPNISGGGSGDFVYTVDLSRLFDKDDFDFTDPNNTLEMTITALDIGLVPPAVPYNDVAFDISSGFDPTATTPVYVVGDTITLPVGYYRVTIELKVNGDVVVSAGGPQILHIYKALDSEYDYIYQNGQLYGVQGTLRAETDLSPELETSLNGGAVAAFDPTVPGDETFPTDLSISATPSDKLEITVTNLDRYTAVSWYANSATALTTAQGVSPAQTVPPAAAGDPPIAIEGKTLTIEAGVAPFAIPRIYHVTVEGLTPGNVPYSTTFRIVIAH